MFRAAIEEPRLTNARETSLDSFRSLFLVGCGYGVVAAAAITFARWLTWEPYSPLLIPYDIAIMALAIGAVFSIVPFLLSRFGSERHFAALATLAVLGVYSMAWAQTLRHTVPGEEVKVLSAVLFLGAAVVAGWRLWRPRSGPSLAWVTLASGLTFAVSILGYRYSKELSLVFPAVVVVLTASGIHRFPAGTGRGFWAALALAATTFLICGLSIFPGSGERASVRLSCERRTGPSVILIILDTVRRDHMSAYGYSRPTTPNVDRWSQGALVFDDAMAVSSWTLPTHASMFTGLYPRSHGANGFRGRSPHLDNAFPLAPEHTTIAEISSAAGICTAALLSNWFFLGEKWNLNQGFATYWAPPPHFGARFYSEWLASWWDPDRYEETDWPYYRDTRVTEETIRWLRAAQGRPFFLVVNYMDVHIPNRRPPNETIPFENEVPPPWLPMALLAHAQNEPIPQPVQNYIINQYDRELFHLDAELGRLFAYLQTSGLDSTTTVILTSDHGEYLGEHDLFGHSMHLYRQTLDVPLIVKGPGVTRGRTPRRVQSTDIFPTVLDSLGVSYDPTRIQGVSLFQNVDRPSVAEWYASENAGLLGKRFHGRFDRDLRVLRRGSDELFEDDKGNVELYDLDADPEERHDLARDRPERVAELRTLLQQWVESHPPPASMTRPVGKLDERDREAVRSLGYVQ